VRGGVGAEIGLALLANLLAVRDVVGAALLAVRDVVGAALLAVRDVIGAPLLAMRDVVGPPERAVMLAVRDVVGSVAAAAAAKSGVSAQTAYICATVRAGQLPYFVRSA
jgi:hypothetical protein